MTKEDKNQYIEENIKVLENMITALKRIKNGEAEMTVLHELDINQVAFRNLMYKKTLGYKESEYLNSIGDETKPFLIATLSGAERLWVSIFKKNYSVVPPYIDKPIERALKKLKPKEEKVLRMRYWECMSYDEISNVIQLSKQRVKEIENKAILKLKHPKISKYLLYGEDCHQKLMTERINYYNEKHIQTLKEYTQAKNTNDKIKKMMSDIKDMDHELAKPVEIDIQDLELTARTYNLLMRNKIRTLSQLTEYTEDEFLQIRSVGMTMLDEVKIKMKKYDATFKKMK